VEGSDPLAPALDLLDGDDRQWFADLVETARAEQADEIDGAVDRALALVPWPLRGRLKRRMRRR
jgi:hypothetical protein